VFGVVTEIKNWLVAFLWKIKKPELLDEKPIFLDGYLLKTFLMICSFFWFKMVLDAKHYIFTMIFGIFWCKMMKKGMKMRFLYTKYF
jgi:hypothetical protein